MAHNLTLLRKYLRMTLPYALLKKLLALVMMTETRPEVYVATMTTVISNYYYYFEETLNHLNSLKFKCHMGDNAAYFCATVLVEYESL